MEKTSHECPHCGKLYQRISHLRRHELTHQTSGQFTCPYCRKIFSRRDVCRKHAVSCTSKDATLQGSSAEIRTVKRGQRSRACDACARSKISCDLGRPCSRCVARNLSCNYVKALEDPSNSPGLDPLRTHPHDDEHEKLSIPFLLELTDPKTDSMLNSLLNYHSTAGEAEPFAQVDAFDYSMLGHSAYQGLFPWSFTHLLADEVQPDMQFFDVSDETSTANEDSTHLDELMDFLISELRSTHELMSSGPFYDAAFDEDVARAVFTARNARSFVSAFYGQYYPSFPFTHKPSFDFETSSVELTLALMLNGSARLIPQDDAISAMKLYRIGELYVFHRLERALPSAQGTQLPPRSLLEILAASLTIHGINSGSNHTRTRNLVAAQRLPFLVSAVRHLGLTGLRHEKPPQETPWAEFVHKEACIRVAAWTAFLSWQEAGSLNSAPLMTVAEMRGDLPCPQALWDAQDETEYQAVLQAPGFAMPSSSSLSDCFDALMRDKWTGISQFPRTPTNLQDMLLIVFSIHAAAVSARLMAMLPTMAPVIVRAIKRWYEVWDATIERLGPDVVCHSGLPRHADSLAWLARGTVEISLAPGPHCAYLRNVGQASAEELHGLVQALRER